MPKPKKPEPNWQTIEAAVHVRIVESRRQRSVSWNNEFEGRQLRYVMEMDWGHLATIVARAATHANGKSVAGPITVVVHPEDRVKVARVVREEG